MKLNYKKSLKFVTLLISTLLIGAASATIYYAIQASSTITIAAAPVTFTSGNDSTGILTPGTNNTSASLSLSAYPNATLTYEQAVNITATANKQVRLRHVSITPADGNPSVSNFTSIVFTLLNAGGSTMGTLTYTITGDNWNEPTSATDWQSISSGQEWTIKVETKAAAGASASVSATIVIAVDVQ